MTKITSTNPADYKVLGEIEISSEAEIEEKVQKAHQAKERWKELGVTERVKLLRKVYDAFDKRKDKIALTDTREMGFPITQCRAFNLGDGFNYFKWYLDNAEKYLAPEVTYEDDKEKHIVHYEPTGVAAVIVPWNFPFCNWSWAVIPQLLVGNTVVFKHSEECALSAKLIEEIVASCNLPDGVFNVVYGDGKVGEYLVNQDIDMISFTGSTKVGRHLYEIAGKKFIKVLMELGGSAPGIVFEDADINEITEIIYTQRFTNCGQACDGLKRLIVHESIFDVVVEKLKVRLESAKVGNPEEETTDFGPLVAKRQVDLLISQVEDAVSKGAKVITGGKQPQNLQGAYYNPTLLTNIKPEMRVWQEEVFGPVLSVVPFKNEDKAIELANDTQYGLGGYIYTKDKERAQRVALRIQTGMVSVNGTNYVTPFNPFGGYKKSGLGREHGKWGLHELCQVKVVAIKK